MLPEVAEPTPDPAEPGSDLAAHGELQSKTADGNETPSLTPGAPPRTGTSFRAAAYDLPIALLTALAAGLRLYLPETVRLFLYAAALASAASFSHFVLGAPAWVSGASLTGGTGWALGSGFWRRRR